MKIHEAEYGNFGNFYSYVKLDFKQKTDTTLVIFPPTQELIFPIHKNPWVQIKRYQPLIPSHIGTVYILGYNPHITINTFLADVAEIFAEFIRERIGPCYIAGISYGGALSIPFASKFPELTQKLIIVVGSYALSESGVQICKEVTELAKKNELLKIQFKMISLFHNPILRKFVQFSTRMNWEKKKTYMNPPSTLINAYTHIVNHNYELKKYIHHIKSPTLIIGGTQDQFASNEMYKTLAEAVKDSKLVLFENQTHTVAVEHLRKVKKLIEDFLKK